MKSKVKKSAKKTKSRKKLITAAVVAFAAIAVIALIFIFSGNDDLSELKGSVWYAGSAKNSSGDEVELSEVYQTNYTSFRGNLTFSDDGTFSLWLSPGNPDDGTHKGKYEFSTDKSKLEVSFDNGATSEFSVDYADNKIKSITVYYNDYEVVFE